MAFPSLIGRRANAALSVAQEKVAADMVEDSQAGPKKIMKRLNRDAKAKGSARHPDDSTRRMGVPQRSQVRSFLKNRQRPLEGTPMQTQQHAGQAPRSPGSPRTEITRVCDLYNWAATIKLPPLISDMNRDEMYSIPMEQEINAHGVEQVHLTCWKFVNWLRQLATKVKVNVTLHIDGLHKMHYGKWLVLAIGTHCLQFYPEEKQYRQSFRPLVLLLGKDFESITQAKVLVLVCARVDSNHGNAIQNRCI